MHLADQIADGVVWLASYPRSGSTWLRFLLTHVLHGSVSSSRQVATHIPDLHADPEAAERAANGRSSLIKTHFTCSAAHPWINRTAMAIHLVRHPRDVMASCFALHRALDDSAGRGMGAADYARSFVQSGGDPSFIRVGFGGWSRHCESWRGEDRFATPLPRAFPVRTVRYEDLSAAPEETLKSILEFLGVSTGAETIREAVVASSREALRSLEHREKAVGESTGVFVGTREALDRGYGFVGPAEGRDREAADAVDDEALERKFGPQMRRLGYLAGNPSDSGLMNRL